MQAAEAALRKKLKHRNPFRIFVHLDQFFYFLFNVCIIVTCSLFLFWIEQDKDYFEKAGLSSSMKKTHTLINLGCINSIFITLVNCLIIMPKTACFQKHLQPHIKYYNQVF